MYSVIKSFGINGVGGFPVSVEVYLSNGMFDFSIVGLPDAAVKEARERVRAAIRNNSMSFPLGKIIINLAPADKKKAGTVYDLPMLLGILAAKGDIRLPEDFACFGEVSLDGTVRPVQGALPMALCACREGVKKLFVPEENANEAAFVDGLEVYPVKSVSQIVGWLRGHEDIDPAPFPDLTSELNHIPDFSDVKGQSNVKRAFEVAAAGGHNILIVGSPGAGKSMMAKRLPGILPDMTKDEMTECTEIHSVAGLTSSKTPVIVGRPFRSPHHTMSSVALSGGGTTPKPGEISLAHNGVLFLDELPEFRSDVLEVLRQPLEDGEVTVSRVSGTVTFPSRFMLVCAMNPCKCGWYGHPSGRCKCSLNDVRRYQGRISGPLLDRIDIITEVPSLEYEELKSTTPAESSAEIKARVNAAREIQKKRYSGQGISCNAYASGRLLNKYCELSEDCEALMHLAFDAMGLTGRSYDRILRVARTIADLEGEEEISPEHIAEAVQYRTFELMK